MPIQLNYTDASTGETIGSMYFTLSKVNIDVFGNNVEYEIQGFVSKTLFQNGKSPRFTLKYTATFAQLGIALSNTLAQFGAAIYNWALANESFFTGGSSVA